MKQLVETIKLVAEKYLENINLIIGKNNTLILEYYAIRNNKKELYKKFNIQEENNKLKITFLPERFIKVTDLEGLEDIILILEKQSNAKEHTQEEIKQIKEKYVEGTKIELIKMYDLQAPPSKIKGFIEHVDDMGTLHIRWENGSSLGLVVGVDEFKVICPLCNQEMRGKNVY